ncbi:MAG: DUF4178 domain-containing protein [Acidobacteriota bacterium]
MGFLDRFRKTRSEPELDPLADLVLAKLKVGYLVDYDLRTWVVTEYSRYSFNGGRTAEEWELTEGTDKLYLERSEQGDAWSLSKTIPLGALGTGVRQHILDHDEAPEQVTYKGTVYYLDDSAGGELVSADGKERKELIQWEFLDEDEEGFVSIVQWSETELSAVAGHFVEEYQFTDILPGEST